MIKKTLIYACFVVALAYGLKWFMETGLRKNEHGIYEKYSTLFFKKNNYNTLVLGSSRAEMHIDPYLLDSLTGLTTYNAGISGATPRMSYIILKSYLVHSTMPKTIFLECDFHISHLNTTSVFNFPRYFPYLSNNVLYSELKKIDPRFTQFNYNPFYSLPFMGIGSISPALHGWTKKSTEFDSFYKTGFFKNTLDDNYGHFNTKIYYSFISKETRNYLDSLILLCKKKDCKLIFTISPAYKDAQKEVLNKRQIIEQYQNIAFINHIPLLNYNSDTSITNHKTYFEDKYHLFYSGATMYTKKIARDYNNICR